MPSKPGKRHPTLKERNQMREKAASALAVGTTKAEAARQAGCDPVSVARWLQEPEFRKLVREVQSAKVSELRGGMIQKCDRIMEVFQECLEGKGSPTQLKAVETAFKYLMPSADAEAEVQGQAAGAAVFYSMLERAVGAVKGAGGEVITGTQAEYRRVIEARRAAGYEGVGPDDSEGNVHESADGDRGGLLGEGAVDAIEAVDPDRRVVRDDDSASDRSGATCGGDA